MILQFQIFVGEEYLGQLQKATPDTPGAYHSCALCCPVCGDIWARVVAEGFHTYFGMEHCERHAPIWIDGGSLVNCMYLLDFRSNWPASVWNRELRMWAEQLGDWAE